MITDLLEVYETDADLSHEPDNLLFQSYHKDMVLTKAVLLFRSGKFLKDFMIYNRRTMQIELLLLSSETIAKRGECQQ